MDKNIIIETDELTKAYNGQVAVDRLTLRISEGEVFGFLGPNGAGKTTTLLMLLGLTEPTGGTARVMGVENNIYLQISLIMLIGLLSKNAILIVEFALQRRRRGMSIVQSALEGARVRLRPILMTSFSFIVSLLPLVLATGIGANGNRSIGVGAVGGMFVGTMLGILVIPVLYVIFQNLQELLRKPVIQESSTSDSE